MQVDDAFVREFESHIVPEGGRSYIGDIIAATLAVAAERGLVVPEGAAGAVRTWAIKSPDGFEQVCADRDIADEYRLPDETVVRVAIVEIKE